MANERRPKPPAKRKAPSPRRRRGDGTVYWDEQRQRWIGAVTVNGKRRKVSGLDKTEAQAKLRELTAARDTGQSIGDRSITVKQLVDRFLERELPSRRDLAPGTLGWYRTTANAIEREIGSRRVHDLSVIDVEDLLDRLAEDRAGARGFSRATLLRVRSVLGQALDFGIARQLVRDNVARRATIPPGARAPEKQYALTPDEASKLLEVLRQVRNGAMFGLSLRLGLRPGEAAGLMWDDLDGDVLHVQHGRQIADASTGKVAITDGLKTERSNRRISLPPDVVEWLNQHRRQQLEERLAAVEWLDDRLMFASTNGNVLFPSNQHRYLTKLCKRAGVPTVSPNELRHTCATLMSHERKISNEELADLLGHTTTRMVQVHYRRPNPKPISVAVEADWTAKGTG